MPTRDGSEIAVIGSALTTLPLGGTPLVATLESLAETPGRIAEAGVSGALVNMSGGGNGCGDITAEQAVERLAAASAKLHARGVEIHVIKLGNGNVPEEDAQLRAIAVNGRAGVSQDPAVVPYMEAPSPEKLNELLATLSDKLASCQLNVGPAPKGADTNSVNLYVDGAVIPFDAQGTKQDGWGWLDPKREAMLMYGDACKHFKQSRSANIVVEFGCVSIVLQ